MRLGITMPHALLGGGPIGPDTIATTARLAERLGFASVWCFDAIGRKGHTEAVLAPLRALTP